METDLTLVGSFIGDALALMAMIGAMTKLEGGHLESWRQVAWQDQGNATVL